MRRATAVLVVLSILLAMPAALGRDDEIRREGSCDLGSEWRLIARRESPTTLRVRYILDTDRPGHTWSVFLSINGSSLFTGTKTTDGDGYIRITRYPRDRAGDDRIRGSANDHVNGESCAGSLLYDR